MATELSKLEWVEILLSKEITKEIDLSILQVLYSSNRNAAPASEIGRILGQEGKKPQARINLAIGNYAKRIARHYEINFTERSNRKFKFWDLFFNGWDRGNKFVWQLKNELKEALEETEMTGVEQFAEEVNIENKDLYKEGFKKTIIVNSYERNPKARQKCIEYWKPICQVCEIDFFKNYGEIGKGFIHVHHIVPISEIGKEYEIDPKKDLIPVCPNCHSMIHRVNPPLTIEELKKRIKEKKEASH